MGWFLWIVGWLMFLAGTVGVLVMPLMYQPLVAPVMVIGALWIGFGAVIERLDMVRKALPPRAAD